jgi:hypothetical protein
MEMNGNMTNKSEPSSDNVVSMYIKKHKVIVTDELLVYIYHLKSCENPCKSTKNITDYLEAELFVKDGYKVSNM